MTSDLKCMEVGLAIGRGTGPELGDVFVKALGRLAELHNVKTQIHQSPRIYHSYHSLFSSGSDFQNIKAETLQDAAHYEDFCKKQATQGTVVIFRTAFTAQSLYLVRQHLEAVKVEHFRHDSTEMLLIRDQAQGFYTGSNDQGSDNLVLSRTCHFSEILFDRIVAYSISRARQIWCDTSEIDSLIMVYKHHLFDGLFDTWAKQWSKKYNLDIQFIQPDTMNRNLLAFGVQRRQLVIAGNEYADIMEVLFLDMFNQGVQETSCSENVYLAPGLSGLVEYQTVHGSADDLTGQGVVNPCATLKAAATILERYGHCKGVEYVMNSVMETLVQQKICTPDQGGTMSTASFVSTALQRVEDVHKHSLCSSIITNRLSTGPSESSDKSRSHSPTLGLKTGLLIIDFQKDFAPSINASSPPLSTITKNISHILKSVRKVQSQTSSILPSESSSGPRSAMDIEIIHVRFLGDRKLQSNAWRHRNIIANRTDVCISGTDGADFIDPIRPLGHESVFEKPCIFDPFLVPTFEQYLKEHQIQHLILVGLYGDVCIDSTARSGFQKGYRISIVQGCVGNLHTQLEEWELFASKVYGARLISVKDMKYMQVEKPEVRPILANFKGKLA